MKIEEAMNFLKKYDNTTVVKELGEDLELMKDFNFSTISTDARGVYGWTPLTVAARRERVSWAKALLNANANVTMGNGYQVTPLHIAVAEDNEEMVKLLLAKKPDLNAKDNEGWTPLHRAVFERFGHYLNYVKMLLDAGADLEVKNKLGETPLHLAVRQYIDEKMVKLLLDAGADPKSKDNSGKTVLDDSLRPVRFLVEAAMG